MQKHVSNERDAGKVSTSTASRGEGEAQARGAAMHVAEITCCGTALLNMLQLCSSCEQELNLLHVNALEGLRKETRRRTDVVLHRLLRMQDPAQERGRLCCDVRIGRLLHPCTPCCHGPLTRAFSDALLAVQKMPMSVARTVLQQCTEPLNARSCHNREC